MNSNPEQNRLVLDTSFLESRQVKDMLTVANEFCLAVEEHRIMKLSQVLPYFASMLPLLYLRGSLLPEIPEEAYDLHQGTFVTEEMWESVYLSYKDIFAAKNSYSVWNSSLNEATEAQLAEDFADIYQDSKDFILLFSETSFHAKMSAVAQFRELFKNRWGAAAVRALSHVHVLLHSNSD